MDTGWDKVARWAGLNQNKAGVNRDDNGDEMAEAGFDEQELHQGATGPDGAGRAETSMDESVEPGNEGAADKTELALAQMKQERDALQDRLARLQAEFDNARKREEKSRLDVRANALGDAVEPFLGVMDNFGLALKAQGSVEQLRGGVELIVKQMDDALRGLNVVPVETVGVQFDPRVHEALGSIETAEHPDHQVLEEIRRGYKLRDRLLRPALVKIASNAGQVND
jgi:molecular chaperone GrpE